MSMFNRSLVVGLIVAALASPASAQFHPPWSDSLPAARQTAASQRRLVLIHFWGENCPPCMMMEHKVFNRSEVQRALSSNYVAVKVNTREAPGLAQHYGVSKIPADVIITPEGELVDRSVGSMTADQYIAMIDRTAALHRAGMPAAPDQMAVTTVYDPRTGQVQQYDGRNSNFVPHQQPVEQLQFNRHVEQLNRDMSSGGYLARPQGGPGAVDRLAGADARQRRGEEAPIAPPYGQQYQPGSTAQWTADYGMQTNRYVDSPQSSQPQSSQPQSPAGGSFQPRAAADNYDPAYAPQAQDRSIASRGGQFDAAAPRGGQQPGSAYADAARGEYQPPAGRDVPQQNPYLNQPQNSPAAPQLAQGESAYQPSNQNQPRSGENNLGAASGGPAAPGRPPEQSAGQPPLALGGYCAVNLVEEPVESKKWAKGDARWGAIHRGRLYLFVGQQQQQRFLAAPDQYAPVLSGADVVQYVDEGKMVDGVIASGVFYGGRVYLFQNEASLDRFWSNPDHYARAAASIAQRPGGQAPPRR